MDGNSMAANGRNSLISCMLFAILNIFTPDNVDIMFKIVTGVGAAVAAIFTSRYYHFATKEKKKAIAKL